MEIREARKSDVPQIIELVNLTFREFNVKNPYAEKRANVVGIPDYYLEKNGKFFVATIKNKVIGAIGVHEVSFREEKAGFIQRLAVFPEYRKQGIGDALYKTVENFAEPKYEYLILGVDNSSYEAALRFYKKRCFKEIDSNIKLPQFMVDDNDEFYFEKRISKL